jgi:hypothetical protein
MHAAGSLVLVACWEDRAAAARCRHDQHPLWPPGSSNPAVPASRNRGLALATMRRFHRHAMLGRKEHHDGMGGARHGPRNRQEDLASRRRSVQDSLALMRRYFDLLVIKDMDAMLELIDDIEWLVVPTGDVIRGKASLAVGAENHWGAWSAPAVARSPVWSTSAPSGFPRQG